MLFEALAQIIGQGARLAQGEVALAQRGQGCREEIRVLDLDPGQHGNRLPVIARHRLQLAQFQRSAHAGAIAVQGAGQFGTGRVDVARRDPFQGQFAIEVGHLHGHGLTRQALRLPHSPQQTSAREQRPGLFDRPRPLPFQAVQFKQVLAAHVALLIGLGDQVEQ